MASPFNISLQRIIAPVLLGAIFLSTPLFLCSGQAHTPPASDTQETQDTKNITFMSYNLKNFLTMDRYVEGKKIQTDKPQEETDALIALIAKNKPDILGVCEIGTPKDVQKFLNLLKAQGLHYPHHEHCGGADRTRHLALFSRFPILRTNSQTDLTYELMGKEETISRGILHAEIEAAGHHLHFLGVHLKSKRPVEGSDQALIRLNEARLLREYTDTLFKADKDAKVLAFGDFNDTPRSNPIRKVKGHGSSHGYLYPIYYQDSRGEYWTHFWKTELSYSVFDYVFTSKTIIDFVDRKKSHIIDDPLWEKASDHRPLLIHLKKSE